MAREESIEALDIRLRRLEYALAGSTNDAVEVKVHAGSVPTQIIALNDRLTRIANQNKPLKRLIQACTPPF